MSQIEYPVAFSKRILLIASEDWGTENILESICTEPDNYVALRTRNDGARGHIDDDLSRLIDIVFCKRYVGPVLEGYALLGVNGLANLGQHIKVVGFLFYPFWLGDMNAVLHLPELIEIIGFDSHG